MPTVRPMMKITATCCTWCGRAVLKWDGAYFEAAARPAGSYYGRAIAAVRVLGGARVVDVRELRDEPPTAHPQHLCSEYNSSGPKRAA